MRLKKKKKKFDIIKFFELTSREQVSTLDCGRNMNG